MFGIIYDMKASWKNVILAAIKDILVIEGNYYFPPNSLKKNIFLEVILQLGGFGKVKHIISL